VKEVSTTVSRFIWDLGACQAIVTSAENGRTAFLAWQRMTVMRFLESEILASDVKIRNIHKLPRTEQRSISSSAVSADQESSLASIFRLNAADGQSLCVLPSNACWG
jgi:hypothetical protein